MIRVGILGATGYTAFELIKILLRHPEVQITSLTSRQDLRQITEVHPQLHGQIDLRLVNSSAVEVATESDCVFSCLPHAASAEAIMPILEATRVIDFSADYRLEDAETYRAWYGCDHPDPLRLGSVVYGLPELFREAIPKSRLIANPGCYTSTSILGLAPLLDANLIDSQDIIIDAKSGVSGAGRAPRVQTLFPECNENLTAYSVGNHRHTPEIEQVLSRAVKRNVRVTFTPHLVPMDRGILCSIYTRPSTDVGESELTEAALLSRYREFYRESPFVRIVDHLPATKYVTGTNFCDITVRHSRGRILVFASIDNLIKGAAGVAVQNFNLMYGFDETAALR